MPFSKFSPVSVLDCPFEDDDEVSSPFQQRLALMEGTKKKLMKKLKRFECLVQLEPVNLANRFASPEFSDNESVKWANTNSVGQVQVDMDHLKWTVMDVMITRERSREIVLGKFKMKKEDQARSLFGISLTDRPIWQQFLICSSGFFFGYLVNGICEEYVYNRLQFSYGWYFTFVQGFVYLVLIYLQGFTIKQKVNPWKTYLKLSAVLMGSHGLTKGSLAYLNYPAQIMFKSTKVLPVMIMGAFIPGLRRKYPIHEYISAVLLVVGLILFTLADANTSPNFSGIGVLMILGALVMDSFLGNLQEAIFTMNPDTTQMEMLFCSTLIGLPFLLPPMILTGELVTAWNSCAEHPYVYGVLVFEAMATFIGQVSVLSLIAIFGAATTAMITTARKAVTLLLSYLIFTKPLTEQHGSGLLLIAMGIILKIVPDTKPPNLAVVSSTRGKNHPKKAKTPENGADEEDEEKRPLV
ncbi:unnamed protein product [Fraxinus pennsylvanica]|uniref:UDP-galactose/UDP-glucose transporter 2-like n=1 Tax=Fraxinus pennsylvanica TaxID=56036 RepID=A0AAD2EE82_9LAMI|nr:unnamed protein product [Fraxinus pennsylvanica]